jgi:hypothetical protein
VFFVVAGCGAPPEEQSAFAEITLETDPPTVYRFTRLSKANGQGCENVALCMRWGDVNDDTNRSLTLGIPAAPGTFKLNGPGVLVDIFLGSGFYWSGPWCPSCDGAAAVVADPGARVLRVDVDGKVPTGSHSCETGFCPNPDARIVAHAIIGE